MSAAIFENETRALWSWLIKNGSVKREDLRFEDANFYFERLLLAKERRATDKVNAPKISQEINECITPKHSGVTIWIAICSASVWEFNDCSNCRTKPRRGRRLAALAIKFPKSETFWRPGIIVEQWSNPEITALLRGFQSTPDRKIENFYEDQKQATAANATQESYKNWKISRRFERNSRATRRVQESAFLQQRYSW